MLWEHIGEGLIRFFLRKAPGSFFQLTVQPDHCMDLIGQLLMCNADVEFIFYTDFNERQPVACFSTQHLLLAITPRSLSTRSRCTSLTSRRIRASAPPQRITGDVHLFIEFHSDPSVPRPLLYGCKIPTRINDLSNGFEPHVERLLSELKGCGIAVTL